MVNASMHHNPCILQAALQLLLVAYASVVCFQLTFWNFLVIIGNIIDACRAIAIYLMISFTLLKDPFCHKR